MKTLRYFIPAIAVMFIVQSCQDKKQAITKSQQKAKIDSLVAIRMQEINTQAMEDLDRRMSIEVKAKADSIVLAKMAAQGTVDNTATGPSTIP